MSVFLEELCDDLILILQKLRNSPGWCSVTKAKPCSIHFPVVRMQPSLVWDSSAVLIARATVLLNTAKGEELKDVRKQSWNLTITNPTSAEVHRRKEASGEEGEGVSPLFSCM